MNNNKGLAIIEDGVKNNKEGLVNLDNMTMDQLEVLQQQILTKQVSSMQERIEKLESDYQYQSRQNELKYDGVKNDINNVKADVTDVKEKLHVLAVEPWRLKELESARKRKVIGLCGGMRTDNYKLFSSLFFGKCQAHVHNVFNVTRYDQIRVDDFDVALTTIKRWKPSRKDINYKIHEYIKQDEEGFLSDKKSKALDRFLEKTNGGTDLPW